MYTSAQAASRSPLPFASSNIRRLEKHEDTKANLVDCEMARPASPHKERGLSPSHEDYIVFTTVLWSVDEKERMLEKYCHATGN